MFLFHPKINNLIDIVFGSFSTLAPGPDGILYVGAAISNNVFKVLTGFDDDEFPIDNFIITKKDNCKTDELKKVKKENIEGIIDRDQSFDIYAAYDEGDFELVGTVLGTGAYVNPTASYTVGSSMLGAFEVGGGPPAADDEVAYYFNYQMRLRPPKFHRWRLKFVATGLGYICIFNYTNRDIRLRGNKIPRLYRDETADAV
jgi:hypothetical protein